MARSSTNYSWWTHTSNEPGREPVETHVSVEWYRGADDRHYDVYVRTLVDGGEVMHRKGEMTVCRENGRVHCVDVRSLLGHVTGHGRTIKAGAEAYASAVLKA